ncbi:MAG TPA: ABC transporter permease [Candidatus Eubacterium faecigallinarum]|nr:ABC transporter permease [Candidatus Eubacterium faecigallinarum]
MNINESLKIAVKCIRANWMRSLLTMLGIIIGISSVIMIIGAGTGVRDYIVGLIEDMGSNAVLVSVDATSATDNDYITLDDVENIKTKVKGVERCSPMLMGFGRATIDKSAKEATAMLVGVNSDVQFALTDSCEYGRFFTDEEYDANAPVAVIGTNSAEMAFGYEEVTNEYITVSSSGKSMKVKICGVANIDQLTSSMGGSSSMSNLFSTGSDNIVVALFIPCTTLTQITGADAQLSSVFVIAEEGYDYDAVGNATVNYLKSAHGNYSQSMYTAQNMATYVEIVDIIMSVLTAFIACVGAISLIVGGIGVMNIMLVSVTERTREIGIRKSLGAKTRVITLQFLTESIILCLIGGAIGVTIGIVGAFAACSIIDITPNITWWLIVVALLFSCGVGLFFGIYPARKAAQMSPIDALRSE